MSNQIPQIATICHNCKWYVEYFEPKFQNSQTFGHCHVGPPTLYIGADGLRCSGFPYVKETDFCGQFMESVKVKLL